MHYISQSKFFHCFCLQTLHFYWFFFSVEFPIYSTGQQQIIKILPNNSGQQLKAISKHALRTADATKVVAQVN